MGVEIGLLGDVEVRVDGRLVDLGHARQRCVLVVLLVEANHVVSVDQLVERVWGDHAPPRSRESIYNYLSRIRHALAPVTDLGLVRRAGGYAVTISPMAVDAHRFRHLITQARTADDEDQALVFLERALELWRGEPCAGLDTTWVNAVRSSLEQDRFAAELDCTDLLLRRGQHGWLLGDIAERARAHPLDERIAGQLMLALYLCGRQAEALEYFQHVRTRLNEELGIDPSPSLQRRHEQILTNDPALAPSQARSASVSASLPVPHQLPARTPHFVGRAAELCQLTALLDASTSVAGGAVVITAIDGTAGIGKTALALHWAHHVADRFPDGQLYVNLRAFDPTNTPVHPADALRGFLDAFTTPAEQIPESMEAQAGLYRSLLADRHVLVVLDNARNADQIRPLLPASPTCLVLITSRNQLAGLVAQEGARPLTLDVLTPHEARALLTRHLGADRVNAEPHAVNDLIEHCARLPLALAIVAARAATHPGFELRLLAKELADEHTRLDALDTGDPTSVRAVFSWSYQALSPDASRMFRLLGLHPGADIALPAATQLADLPTHRARQALSELARVHLLTEYTPGRYTFHDLLRAYAAQLTTTHDAQDEQRSALTRLFDHYLSTAAAAMETLRPSVRQRRADAPSTLRAIPSVADPVTAQLWLNAERGNLTATIAHTAIHGWHIHTTQLANTVLLRYDELGGLGAHYLDALAIYGHVRHAAHHTQDQVTEALALTNIGVVHWRQGHYQQATNHHQRALEICREIGNRAGEALAVTGIGLVHWQQGRYQQATNHHQQAIVICRQSSIPAGEALAMTHLSLVRWRQGCNQQAINDLQRALEICHEMNVSIGEALALTSLGLVHWQQGRYQQATNHHKHALAICREIGDRVGELWALSGISLVYLRQAPYQQAMDHNHHVLTISRETKVPVTEALALTNLGAVDCRQGHYQQANDHHLRALAICREIGYPVGQAFALTHLGLVHGRQGQFRKAIGLHRQALAISREIGDRANEALILNGLGETYRASEQLEQAHSHYVAALAEATQLGDRYEQARAHDGLAYIHHSTGDLNQARHHWQRALAIFTHTAVPEADDARVNLTAVDEADDHPDTLASANLITKPCPSDNTNSRTKS